MPFAQPRKLNADELRDYALKLLAARPLSIADLKEKLRRRAADPTSIDPIVSQLKDYGALDDRRFAERFSSLRADSGTFGRQRVFADLLKRRVAPKVAEKAVRQAYDSTDEPALVTAWLERKYRNQNLAELLKEPARLASAYRRLRLAGFSTSSSIKVLKRFAAEADQLDSLEDAD